MTDCSECMNPVEQGKLLAKVDALEHEVKSMKTDIRALLDLANQSKGGFWVGMTIASIAGALVTWVTTHFPFVLRG